MREVAISGRRRWKRAASLQGKSFDRYGIPRPLGAWTAITGPRLPLFGYIVGWNSLKSAMRLSAVLGRPFVARGTQSHRCGIAIGGQDRHLVDESLTCLGGNTRRWTCWPVGGVHEMRIHHTRAGYAHYLSKTLAEIELPQCKALGAAVLGVFDVVIGPRMPAIISFIAWPDF